MSTLKILKSVGCHGCAQAEKIWEKIKGDYPNVDMETVDIVDHPEVVAKYRLLASPGIVVNDRLVAQGGIDEKKFRELLEKAEA